MPELEAVLADHESRNDYVVRRIGRGVVVVRIGRDLAGDAEAREGDGCGIDPQQLLRLALVLGWIVIRVVADADASAIDDDHVRHRDVERGNLDRELAGCAYAAAATADDAKDVDVEVELAEQAAQFRRNAAVRLLRRGLRRARAATEVEFGDIDADGHRYDELAVLEAEAREADRWAFERKRPDRDGVGGGRRVLHRARDGEAVARAGVRDRRAPARGHDLPGAGDELDEYFAVEQCFGGRDTGLRSERVTPGRRVQLHRRTDQQAARTQRQIRRAGTGEFDFVAGNACDRAATRREERDVDVALGVDRLLAHLGAAERTCQLSSRRRNRQRGCRFEDEEAVDAGLIDCPCRVREAAGEILDLDLLVAQAGVEATRKRVTEGAVVVGGRDLGRRPVEGDAACRSADQRKLRCGIGDRALVQADAVDVIEDHIDVAARIEHRDVEHRAAERIRENRSRGPQRRCRRRNGGTNAEDRVTGDAQVLQLEALAAAERETRRAAQAEDLAAIIGVVDGHRGIRNIDIDLSGGCARETRRSGERDHIGGAQREQRVVLDIAVFVEADFEDFGLGAGREPHPDGADDAFARLIDAAVAVIVLAVCQRIWRVRQSGQIDHFVQRQPGAVDAHRHRALHRQPFDADQCDPAERVHGESVVGRGVGRGGAELDHAHRGASDQHADRVRIEIAIFEPVRPFAQEDFDVARTVGDLVGARLDGEVAA